MLEIRKMSSEDYAFAVDLTDTMGWNFVEEDFKFMTELEPDGCFIVVDGSERIGLATTISFGRVGWLGNVIVSESHRGGGIGSHLVRHTIEYLRGNNVETVGLYSYIERIPFYTRLGFKYDSEFVMLKGRGSPAHPGACLKRVEKGDVNKIIDLDCSCFGALRIKLLEPLLSNPDNPCFVYFEDESVLGYILAKVYGGMAEIGPLVCRGDRSDIAMDLLMATFNRLGGLEVSMCVPERELTILNALKELGFREDFRVAKMFFGGSIPYDCIYVAESLERG